MWVCCTRVQRMDVRWKTGMRRKTEMEGLIARALPCAEMHKIKRHKTAMRREILQLCHNSDCFLFTFFALEFLSSRGKKQQQIS